MDLFALNLLLVLFLFIVGGFLVYTGGTVGQLDLAFILTAIIIAGILAYLGSIVRVVLRGNLVAPISESVYYLAPPSVMAILFLYGPSAFPPFLETLAVPALVLGAVLSAENIARARRGPAGLVLRAVALLAATVLFYFLASGTGHPDLGGAVLIGGGLAAAVSMLGLFREHSDIRLRAIGTAFARTWVFILYSLLIISVTVYTLYLRPLAIDEYGGAITMVEWMIVGVTIIVLSLLFRRTMREVPEGKLTPESMVGAAMTFGSDRTKVVEAVGDFVADGRKERLLVMLVTALKGSGLDDGEVSTAVSDLVRYREDPVPVTWAWTYGDLMERRRQQRHQVIKDTLDAAVKASPKKERPRWTPRRRDDMDITEFKVCSEKIVSSISSVFVGDMLVARKVLCAALANGHVLFEDNPGLGKTLLARTFAQVTGCDWGRVQFTPDLMPADILGTRVWKSRSSEFVMEKGPIFTNIVLADEINRSPPKTQAALLEAMEERQATIEGVTYELPRPFFVIATQNPIEHEGTFRLPEAQLDRFLLKMSTGYVSTLELESEILRRRIRWGSNSPGEW